MNKMIFPLIAFLFFSKMLAAQVDTVPPVLVCKSHLDVPTYQFCHSTNYAVDFLDTFSDNINQGIELGIRKACVGTGFPLDNINNPIYTVTFSGGDWGEQAVEVWARDAAGNVTSCITLVYVFDATSSCDPFVTITTNTPTQQGIHNVNIGIKGNHCYWGAIDYQISTYTWGYWEGISHLAHTGSEFAVTPSKNINPLNGVSTYDLVLIQKHILGIELLDSPWKIIAADANQDGKVTTLDIITLRKLILGITTELPNGKSWRFAPKDYVFPNPANPFQPPFPERIEVPNTADPVLNYFQFTGVKIGDVDFSADPNQ